MRLSGLSLAVVLLFSSVVLAQHSAGGGGGSSGGGGGGGGSHGGSVSSGGSGGGHSSGGSSSHSSGGGHSSGGHGSGSISSHSGVHGSQTHGHSILGSNRSVNPKTAQPEKRSFFSFLRHPFRKPEPKPELKAKLVTNLRRPICLHGRCPVCLPGHGCGVLPVYGRRNICSARDIWSGGACLLQTPFLDDCSGLRRMMEQQALRMQAAEAEQQSACSTAGRQDCSDLTSAAQSEGNLYRTLQDRYRMCRQRSLGAFPFTAFGFSGYSAGLLLGSLDMELDF